MDGENDCRTDMEKQSDCKTEGMSRPLPTTYIQKKDILYIVENETSPNATETASEIVKRLILRDAARSFSRKLWGFIVPLDIFIDILSAICKYMIAWGLSGRRKYE